MESVLLGEECGRDFERVRKQVSQWAGSIDGFEEPGGQSSVSYKGRK